jgi:SH3-like domain-containing protein
MKVFYAFVIIFYTLPGLLAGCCSGFYNASQAFASDQQVKGRETGLPIPRFVSLRSDEVNMRSGPGVRYPIRWVYHRKNMPVEIVQEFDAWRKLRDVDGAEGWVHKSLISGRRYSIIQHNDIVAARSAPDVNARVTFRIEPGAIARLEECDEKASNDKSAQSWCRLSVSGYDGWVEKKFIWGIYAGEGIN